MHDARETIEVPGVSGCADDNTKRELCESVIQFAHYFDRLVVGDGIERPQDAQTLKRLGCDLGQGLLLEPPMSKDKLRQLVKIIRPLRPHP